MLNHTALNDKEVRKHIRSKSIVYAGNSRLMIYGLLTCRSGKRMKRQNRVFFSAVKQARAEAFRPCGHCLRADYNKWKNGLI